METALWILLVVAVVGLWFVVGISMNLDEIRREVLSIRVTSQEQQKQIEALQGSVHSFQDDFRSCSAGENKRPDDF